MPHIGEQKNEWFVRLVNPDGYKTVRRDNDKFGAGISVQWGIKKASEKGPKGGRTEIQSIHFSKDKFDKKAVSVWLKKHPEFKPIIVEDAAITTASAGALYDYRPKVIGEPLRRRPKDDIEKRIQDYIDLSTKRVNPKEW